MFRCRKMRGLLAASAYEALPEPERLALERHLASCDACRAEAQRIPRVVAVIPRTRPEVGFDLAPLLRSRMEVENIPTARTAWAWGTLAAAVALVCVIGLVFAGQLSSGPRETPVARALRQAQELASAGQQANAYALLEETVAQHPRDPRAGEAQLRLADIAFAGLHRYDWAEEAYRKLVSEYPETAQSSPDAKTVRWRREALDEGKKDRYASLYAFDQAQANPAAAFSKYEGIIAKNPTGFTAERALAELVAMASPGGSSTDAKVRVEAMKALRDRSQRPEVVAKLNLEIGHAAWRLLNDPVLARDAYQKAADSPEPVLAKLAQESLEDLSRAWSHPVGVR